MEKTIGKLRVNYVFDEVYSVQIHFSGDANVNEVYDLTGVEDPAEVNMLRYERETSFVATYEHCGILRIATGTIDLDGKLKFKGENCLHKNLKNIKGYIALYLEAGEPTE